MNNRENQQERLNAELGWLAGAIDGEGCFSICLCKGRKFYLYPMINISNTDNDFTDEVIRILDKYNIPHYINIKKYKNSKYKECKQVFIKGMKRTKRFIELLHPFFARKKRVDIFKEFIDRRIGQNILPARWKYTYSPKDIELVMQLRKLNGNRNNVSSESICQTLNIVSDDVLRTVSRDTESVGNKLTA